MRIIQRTAVRWILLLPLLLGALGLLALVSCGPEPRIPPLLLDPEQVTRAAAGTPEPGCGVSVPMVAGTPGAPEQDWYTGNEVNPKGDWNLQLFYTQAGGADITRANIHYSGNHSYYHYSDCPDSRCWAFTIRNCGDWVYHGYMEGHFLMDGLPGIGVLKYPIMAGFILDDYSPPTAPDIRNSWEIVYDSPTGNAMLRVYDFNPNQDYMLGPFFDYNWHKFAVEWYLKSGEPDCWVRAWMDDVLWIEDTHACDDSAAVLDTLGAGVKDWLYLWGDELGVYVDDVTIYGCNESWPTPTPTPEATAVCDCDDRYGHAATLNVSPYHSSIIRFENLLSSLPGNAELTYAGLKIYGVAMEDTGQWITIGELVPQWGETTANWCKRLMWTDWAEPGASNVPLDRYAGTLTTFEAQLGWQQIDLPVEAVTKWLTEYPSAGIILYDNDEMSAKIGFASREYYDADEDYGPKLILNWEGLTE